MLPRRRRHFRGGGQDLNVTAFMNLMAVLTPFLLATAVFTRLAILEVYLPPPTDQPEGPAATPKDQLVLTVTITDRGLIVANGNNIVGFIASTEQGHNLEALSQILQELKVRYPEEENAIILSTPMIPYETVVAVMDTTLTIPIKGTSFRQSLFPNISLGEVQ